MEEQIQNLAREVTRLRASLQREKQRRGAIAESIRHREFEKDEAERKLRLAEYTNARLVQEIETLVDAKAAEYVPKRRIKHNKEEDYLHDNGEDLEIESQDGTFQPLSLTYKNLDSEETQTPVDIAIRKMEATIPQYRATTTALQSRVALLTKQLQVAVCERDSLKLQVTKWKANAQENEKLYANATARLHSQEAFMASSDKGVQEKLASLETSLLSWRQRAQVAEQELSRMMQDMQIAQKEITEQKKINSLQKSTIERLEATIKEQQQDIHAALSCQLHQTQEIKHPDAHSPETTMGNNKTTKKKEKENELPYKDSTKMATLTKEIAHLRAALSEILQ